MDCNNRVVVGRELKQKLTKIIIFFFNQKNIHSVEREKKHTLIYGYKEALAKHTYKVDDNPGQKGSKTEKAGTQRKTQEKQRQQNTRADAKVE